VTVADSLSSNVKVVSRVGVDEAERHTWPLAGAAPVGARRGCATNTRQAAHFLRICHAYANTRLPIPLLCLGQQSHILGSLLPQNRMNRPARRTGKSLDWPTSVPEDGCTCYSFIRKCLVFRLVCVAVECIVLVKIVCVSVGALCKNRHVRRVMCVNYLCGFCLEGPNCKFVQ